ncbi:MULTISPECIES: hypothetical protein [unclassified Streptomyces]
MPAGADGYPVPDNAEPPRSRRKMNRTYAVHPAGDGNTVRGED